MPATLQSPPAPAPPADHGRRVEELGRIILAYSEVTERLEQSHAQLNRTVQALQQALFQVSAEIGQAVSAMW